MLVPETRRERRPWPTVAGVARPLACPAYLLAVVAWVQSAQRAARHEARKDGSYLVPVRIFIGVGWLRAFAEKAVEPGWHDGSSLSTFLVHQLHAGLVAFPSYQELMRDLFLPHAAPLGWLVMLGQALVGIAVVSGSLTHAALLGGIFMNLNFVLAGAPDPSAFYIVIQVVLLLAGAGTVFGVDGWLLARRRSPFGAARSGSRPANRALDGPGAIALAALALGSAGYASLHIRDWTPGGSVHDSAAILAVLAVMTAAWIIIALLRSVDARPARR